MEQIQYMSYQRVTHHHMIINLLVELKKKIENGNGECIKKTTTRP